MRRAARLTTVLGLGVSLALGLGGTAAAEPAPPRATHGAPWRVRLGLEHRTRFEHLAGDFRAGATGDATALALRTLVTLEATGPWLRAGLEVQDARLYATAATPLDTTLINPLDLLQAYVGIARAGVVRAGDRVDARLGRITLDLGSRRLLARNKFRNTLNAFTGVDARWTSPARHVARGFVVVPVTRRPTEPADLDAHALALDAEHRDALVWGGFYGAPGATRTQLELFVVGYHERDGALASRNRQLVTGGVRWFRPPAPGALDFELELLPQAGTARATAAPDDVRALSHRALATHVELGISPALAWRPRLVLEHDLATGDRDPTDGTLERFDPLFGARRFDLGPTGIYGPLARGNLQSPGLRIAVAPTATLDAVASYRLAWLAAAHDAWPTARLRDPSGQSGRFIGEHVEVQLRWRRPPHLHLEAGAAYLRRGQFARTAPEARTAPAAYVYTQLTVTL